jgi:putative phosphoesterase
MRVGVVSDTHGLLRPEVPPLLAGCDLILHAGDVGDAAILAELGAVAPVTAVRGNVDVAGSLARLPDEISGELDGVRYRMAHRREDLAGDDGDRALLVFGHSHRPEIAWRGSCLLLNPGACGPRRFRLPLTLAVLEIRDGRVVPELRAVE